MFQVINLSEQRSAIDGYLYQLRDVDLQRGKHAFRENVRRIGRAVGYEISKKLNYKAEKITTPMDVHDQFLIADSLVIITILRAGLPLHEGILDVFPEADSGYVSAYRKHDNLGNFVIEIGYVACPDLTGKILILNDPMLATGSSFENALTALEKYGTPKSIHLVSVIASAAGAERILNHSAKGTLWVGAIDPKLDSNNYIVPGLGDAGDLAFGPKLQR